MQSWLARVLRDFLTVRHKCILDTHSDWDDGSLTEHTRVILFHGIEEVEFNLEECRLEGEFFGTDKVKIPLSDLLEFLPFLTVRKRVPFLTTKCTEFAIIIRHNNQMTFPQYILDKLKVERPSYGYVVVVELKKVMTRAGKEITGTELLRLLGGESSE